MFIENGRWKTCWQALGWQCTKTTRTKANAEAEKAAADLARARRKQAAVKTNKNWMKTVGLLKDSPFEREAWALGEEWRRGQTDA